MVVNNEPNFVFAQPSYWGYFSDEDNLESQEIEKTQEVRDHNGKYD